VIRAACVDCADGVGQFFDEKQQLFIRHIFAERREANFIVFAQQNPLRRKQKRAVQRVIGFRRLFGNDIDTAE